jgi:hypothetical protein
MKDTAELEKKKKEDDILKKRKVMNEISILRASFRENVKMVKFKPPEETSIDDSIDMITGERDAYLEILEMNDSKNAMKDAFCVVAQIMEWLCRRYDVFGLNIDGWNDSLHEYLDENDRIVCSVYEQVKRIFHFSPVVILVIIIIGSLAMYIASGKGEQVRAIKAQNKISRPSKSSAADLKARIPADRTAGALGNGSQGT